MKKLIRPISIANALLLSTTILSSAAILTTHTSPAQAQTREVRFMCESTYSETAKRKVPTTIVWTPTTGKSAIIKWVKPFGNFWTPERRCNEFSQRIDKAYQAGTLYLTNGRRNGKNVICTATEVNGSCKNVLMTLRPQDKPLVFLTELKEELNGRSVDSATEHSSGEPQIYIQIDWDAVVKNKNASKVN